MNPVHIIDLAFRAHEGVIAAFAIETSGGLALVETGPYSTHHALCQGLESRGLDPARVTDVFLTHIHLDHAGGAWAWAEAGATIHVHPFGLRHLASPEKLMASAKRIYGHEMDRLWGDMRPIPEDRLHPVNDGDEVNVADISLQAWHTPGHARHHIAWQLEGGLFTGDVAGVSVNEGLAVPPTPPPDIDLDEWRASLAKLRSLQPDRLYLTHFGTIEEPAAFLTDFEARLERWGNWVREQVASGRENGEIEEAFKGFVREELEEAGLDEETCWRYESVNPAWMGGPGLIRYWRQQGVGLD
ncbi:MAG: MBL fold metallo-hydrolase [Verrucomicrobiota bacterium]